MNVITLVAIAAFVSSVYGNSQCGPSSLRDHIEKLKKDHCSGLEGVISSCCEAHNRCKGNVASRDQCNGQLCECLQAATKTNEGCRLSFSDYLCNTVRLFSQHLN